MRSSEAQLLASTGLTRLNPLESSGVALTHQDRYPRVRDCERKNLFSGERPPAGHLSIGKCTGLPATSGGLTNPRWTWLLRTSPGVNFNGKLYCFAKGFIFSFKRKEESERGGGDIRGRRLLQFIPVAPLLPPLIHLPDM